jgi:4-hydroxybenzoate polyprenyltransferase
MKKWATYLNERSPLAILLIIGLGMSTYPLLLIKEATTESIKWPMFYLSILLNLIIFIMMRMGDEIKDLDKDLIINPTRPLPRGLIPLDQFKKVFFSLLLPTLVFVTYLNLTKNFSAATSLLFTNILALLMYYEFFMGKKLEQSPFVYALTHQIIVFPLYAWAGLSLSPDLLNNHYFIWWITTNFFASFNYEISRKLDPNAHQLAATYAHHYGRKATALICLSFNALILYGSFKLSIYAAIIPIVIINSLLMIKWIKAPSNFKLLEGLAGLISLIVLWANSFKLIWKLFI